MMAFLPSVPPRGRSPFPAATLLACAALLALALAGCTSKLTAAHLVVKPWEDGGSLKIYAKFMHFDLLTQPHEGQFEVKGTAWPIKENLPLWADTVEDLTLAAYLCDEKGNVLVKAQKTYPTQAITPSGFAFDLLMKHPKDPSGGYFVAVGYSGMFTASKPPAAVSPGSGSIAGNYVFFASEKAALSK
ncbi:hypothetical protein NNJEOMEG_00607 [Fundidesulfovibrio magnetotacticus]|uniref:Lipoprotein n=1 Tax=Fundidesulfovibrio magnetotacticus TaxID=2730080 RepID=A0A6V8LP63_9BACT|nr:hypothetical protein [Fundidesulfovibrio magnetotacticus]GFK92780.1 hypothetical protein NNJEOMEG_00607 [Fundidesulfovibrio magnetotacticus]